VRESLLMPKSTCRRSDARGALLNCCALAGALIFAPSAMTAQSITPAAQWKAMSEVERAVYVRGVSDGATMATALVAKLLRSPEAGRWLWPTPTAVTSFDSAAVAATEEIRVAGPGNLAKGQAIVTSMNQLYVDAANTCVPLLAALTVAEQRLRGVSADSVNALLERSRASGASGCGR
jgi:hypothetical protein